MAMSIVDDDVEVDVSVQASCACERSSPLTTNNLKLETLEPET